MKTDFSKMTDNQLQHVLTFTTALADRIEQEKQIDFGAMETTDESLADAERDAREYAKRRKATFGITAAELAETDEIRRGIRDYYRRTRKVVKG